MGNTPTKDAQQEMYASYIQQQQDLIFKQQQQINELYKYNLENQQMAPNMLFQQGIANQSYENGRRNFGSIPTQHRAFADMGYTLGDFPEAEWIGNNGVHIGCHQYLSEDDVERICVAITDALSRCRESRG